MARRKKRVRKATPAINLAWVNYRTKGAITIFNEECFKLLTPAQARLAEAAREALLDFIDCIADDLGHEDN